MTVDTKKISECNNCWHLIRYMIFSGVHAVKKIAEGTVLIIYQIIRNSVQYIQLCIGP